MKKTKIKFFVFGILAILLCYNIFVTFLGYRIDGKVKHLNQIPKLKETSLVSLFDKTKIADKISYNVKTIESSSTFLCDFQMQMPVEEFVDFFNTEVKYEEIINDSRIWQINSSEKGYSFISVISQYETSDDEPFIQTWHGRTNSQLPFHLTDKDMYGLKMIDLFERKNVPRHVSIDAVYQVKSNTAFFHIYSSTR
ncbi:MAG: hypothetical protein ACIAQZ_05655 [Sedimentisphaeraceae bacterium JB056]